ncbi:hypothetical protein EVJ58_g1334 [Rhodofomes roseus]|uniref:Beta-trefoil DNA-binding domain-containing protein n=1 Tax=Rhodofomes roseus TaxID=34475 RepID=A0A4Y9YZW8_9APHY|nr:hypothetical protein EVJ58_g1334 [Rhodofomes roseus]
MASTAWLPLHSASPDRRSDFDILKSSAGNSYTRERKMSIDFTPSGTPQGMYGQPDLDHPFSSLQSGGELGSSHHSNGTPGGAMHMNPHSLDRVDALDVPDQGYDIFSGPSSSSLSGQRFNATTGPSSSMPTNYSLGNDAMYSQNPFSDSMSSFPTSNTGSYDMMGGLPSTLGNGKPSSLTPGDGVSNFHRPSGFSFGGQAKDFHGHDVFQDVDRRAGSVGSGNYHSEFSNDYGAMSSGPGMGMGFNPSQLQQFPDRMGRMSTDSRYVSPLSLPNHLHQGPGSDMLRGVNPHAMHGFRSDGSLPSYDDMGQYLAPNPQGDFPLRIPSVDLSRMRLQQSSAAATDLQTFIRPYLDQYVRSTNRLAFGERTVIVMSNPFIVYIVDVNKPAGGVDSPPPPPLFPEYPSPPPNAIPFTNNGSQIPVYYNQTVVLQCLTSGVVSPVLIIRKVDHQTIVVGGGLQEGAKGIADHYCSVSEVCGDPVSQLHKIAFEVYDPSRGAPEPGTPGQSGAFLSCMGEKVNTYRPVEGRQWNSPQGAPPTSPDATDFPTNDGGRVKKPKRGSSSTGGISKPASQKGRRRPTSAGSAGSGRRGSASDSTASSGALWQVDIGETSVWTIVGTDQIRYNFYVPPVLFDNQNAPQTGSFPIPSKPVTPFPGVVKYLPPDRAAEIPKHHTAGRAALAKPNPHTSKMLTVYGENFSKTDPVTVFFGSEPSPYVEVRCGEVLGCLPPESQVTKRRPIILVRYDGVVFPSNVMYP